ncbi:ABC transporter permease, partial [Candidatus Latescibacterota bacterium]
MLTRILAIITKEIYHILRDPRTLVVVFVMPILMVILFGHALNMDIEHISIGVIDRDNSYESRDVLRAFSASRYFDIIAFPRTHDEIESLFRTNVIKAAIVIPEGFGKDRGRNTVSNIQILVDGSDPVLGNASVNYSSAILYSLAI